MLTPTHLVFAQTCYFATCAATGHIPSGLESAAALLGAVLPDLDSPASYVGRLVWPLAGWIERRFGHRTVTHSLLAQLLGGALAWWLLPSEYAAAVMIGWGSHTFADLMTPSGICWFWPSRVRCILPGNVRFRMQTMGGGEFGFLIFAALLGVALLPAANSARGTSGLMRAALGQIASARAEYDADKGTAAFAVRLTGRDNRTNGDIAGRYPVRGTWREGGLIVDTPDGPRSVCDTGNCDWHAVHTVLERGSPLRTVAVQVKATYATASAVAAALAPWQARGTVVVLGTVTAADIKADPPTLEAVGEKVELVYADPGVFARWGARVLRDIDLTAQVSAAPNADLPTPAPITLAPPPLIDARLQRWMHPQQSIIPQEGNNATR